MWVPKFLKKYVVRKAYKEVMRKMPILQRFVGDNLAGILGVLQLAVPLIREAINAVLRLANIFFKGKGLEPVIVQVTKISVKVEDAVHWLKNTFLGKDEKGNDVG